MDWRQMRTEAAKKARQAEALYLDEDGDIKLADDLAAEAKELFEKSAKLEQLEKINEPAGNNGGIDTAKAGEVKEELLRRGFTEDQASKMLGSLDPETKKGGAAQDDQDGTKSFGDFLACVRFGNRSRLTNVYGSKFDTDAFKGLDGSFPWMKDLTEGSGPAGGYLVPTQQLTELLRVPDSGAVVRPRARKIRMTGRSLTIPVLDQSGTPSAYWQLDYYGGVLAYWTEEGGTKTETEPAFKELELVPHKLAGYTQASDELLADSAVGLESLLMELFRGAIVTREDFAFLRGTGAGMPLGVMNSGALLTQDRATASVVEYRDLARMMDQILPAAYANGVWAVDVTTLPQLLTMEDTAGNNVFIPNESGGVTQGMPGSMFGRPVVVTEKLPNLGSTGDVLFADFSYYIIGDRQATTIAASEHYAFTSDLTTWRFVHRVDGHPWLDAPIYIDTTNTVSPFVALHANTTS